MLGTGAEEGLGGGANPVGHAAGSAGPVEFPGMHRCMPGALHQRQLGTLTLQVVAEKEHGCDYGEDAALRGGFEKFLGMRTARSNVTHHLRGSEVRDAQRPGHLPTLAERVG